MRPHHVRLWGDAAILHFRNRGAAARARAAVTNAGIIAGWPYRDRVMSEWCFSVYAGQRDVAIDAAGGAK